MMNDRFVWSKINHEPTVIISQQDGSLCFSLKTQNVWMASWSIVECWIHAFGPCAQLLSVGCLHASKARGHGVNIAGHVWVPSAICFNSLWPSETIWQQRSWSALAQVMAWCLMEPSHYLNQCWLIISTIQWHSSDGNFMRCHSHQSQKLAWKYYWFR